MDPSGRGRWPAAPSRRAWSRTRCGARRCRSAPGLVSTPRRRAPWRRAVALSTPRRARRAREWLGHGTTARRPRASAARPAPGGEGPARPTASRSLGRRPEPRPAVDDVPVRLLIGEPGDRVALIDAGATPVAHAGGERLLQRGPLGPGEIDRVVVALPKRLQPAALLVRRDALAGDGGGGAETRLGLLEPAHGPNPGHVDLLHAGDRGALIVDVAGPIPRHLRLQWQVALVPVRRRQPAIYRLEPLRRVARVADQRGLPEPDHVVARHLTLLALEPGADGPRPVGVVERSGVGAAQVDDRHAGQVVRLVDAAAAIDVAERRLGPVASLGDGVQVDVRPADLRVQVDELGGRDLAPLQRRKAELDADVADGQTREAVAHRLLGGCPHALGSWPQDVDHVVGEGAADAVGIRLGVVVVG